MDKEVTPFLNSLYHGKRRSRLLISLIKSVKGKTSDAETMLETGVYGFASRFDVFDFRNR